MSETSLEIEPTEGIGCIKFRDSIAEVRRRLGPPDEAEDLDDATTFWYYRALKLQIALLSADWPWATMEKQVYQFVTRHPSTTIWGRRIIGRSEAEVVEIFRDNGCLKFSVSDQVAGSFNYRALCFEEPRISLDFRNGSLLSILCGDALLPGIAPVTKTEQ